MIGEDLRATKDEEEKVETQLLKNERTENITQIGSVLMCTRLGVRDGQTRKCTITSIL